jgi:diacylglycerol kinase (ATP)
VASGFGNLFARALGQPRSVAQAVELLEHGEVVDTDVGTRNGELFVCQESYGLLANIQSEVEESAHRTRARWRRALAYYRMALHHLRGTPRSALRVSVDGRLVTREAAIVTVANVETYGRWLDLTPDASPIDGLLDVFVMPRATGRELMASLLKRQLHLPGSAAGALVCRGRRVLVEAPHGVRDQIGVMPGRLPVLLSAETSRALERQLTERDGIAARRVA